MDQDQAQHVENLLPNWHAVVTPHLGADPYDKWSDPQHAQEGTSQELINDPKDAFYRVIAEQNSVLQAPRLSPKQLRSTCRSGSPKPMVRADRK